jgi:hypothetical protein
MSIGFFSFSVDPSAPPAPHIQPLIRDSVSRLTKILNAVDISGHGTSSTMALLDLLSCGLDKVVMGGRVDLGERGCVCHCDVTVSAAVGGLEQWKMFVKLEAW